MVFIPAFAYNVGRVVSYTAIGLILGFMGMFLGRGSAGGISPFFQGILKLIAGVFMVIMGINMLDLFPGLKKFNLRMPKFFAAAVGRQKRWRSLSRRSVKRPDALRTAAVHADRGARFGKSNHRCARYW